MEILFDRTVKFDSSFNRHIDKDFLNEILVANENGLGVVFATHYRVGPRLSWFTIGLCSALFNTKGFSRAQNGELDLGARGVFGHFGLFSEIELGHRIYVHGVYEFVSFLSQSTGTRELKSALLNQENTVRLITEFVDDLASVECDKFDMVEKVLKGELAHRLEDSEGL